MAENKTRPTAADVDAFLAAVPDPQKRADAIALKALFERVTGEQAVMWGPGIVGFGSYHYKYASGREGDSPVAGFSPRVKDLTIYVASDFEGYGELLAKLGRHSTGKVCLYIKRLDQVDLGVLEEIIRASTEHVRKTHAGC